MISTEKMDPAKKIIIFDLDETCVHSLEPDEYDETKIKTALEKYEKENANDEILYKMYEEEDLKNKKAKPIFYVVKRKGIKKFIEALSTKYRICVWTAATRDYAIFIMDKIFPVLPEWFFWSYHCKISSKKSNDNTKNLKLLKKWGVVKSMDEVVCILDDNKKVYTNNKTKCVLVDEFVLPFHENSDTDFLLKTLLPLMNIHHTSNKNNVNVVNETLQKNKQVTQLLQ